MSKSLLYAITAIAVHIIVLAIVESRFCSRTFQNHVCFVHSSPLPLSMPKMTRKLLSFTEDGESERSTPTESIVTEESREEVTPATPASPVFARTRKISQLATRRRIGLEKNPSRSSLEPGNEFPVKASSVTDMRAHEQTVARQNVKADRTLSTKASLSMSDLTAIDKRTGDVSCEETISLDKQKSPAISKMKKAPQRIPKRLRSASLDEGKVLRGERTTLACLKGLFYLLICCYETVRFCPPFPEGTVEWVIPPGVW